MSLPVSLRLVFFATLVGLALPACLSARQRACVVPYQGRDIARSVHGEWTIEDWQAMPAGTIVFEDDRFRAASTENTLFGEWELVERQPNEHLIHLLVEGYDAEGVRELYGHVDVVELRLVFANWDRIYAVQGQGTWTRWDRVAEAP